MSSVVWTADGEHVAITAREKDEQFSQIWIVSATTGETQRVTNDLISYGNLSAARNSTALLAVQRNVASGLQIADFDKQAATLSPRTLLTESYFLDNAVWTADDRILYSSGATGKNEVWRIAPDGANPTQLFFSAV